MEVRTLKKNKEFAFVYRRGKPAGARDMTLIFVKSRYGGIRVGFSVSKKVGNSVVRNRARRRLKEAFRLILPELHGNYSLVFIAKESISRADFKQIQAQMKKTLERAGLISPSGLWEEKV